MAVAGGADLDVEPCFSAGLNEHHIELTRFGITLLNGHLPGTQRVV